MENTKQQPINLGRNKAKREQRAYLKAVRKVAVNDAAEGVKAPKLKIQRYTRNKV